MIENDDIKRKNALQDGKEIEFYSQSYAAWFNTSMELDRNLLTISVGGIGFLLTVVNEMPKTIWHIIFFSWSVLGFLLCIVLVLCVFHANRKHIQDALMGQWAVDPRLEILDQFARITFGVAIICATFIGLSTTVNKFNLEGGKNVEETGKQ